VSISTTQLFGDGKTGWRGRFVLLVLLWGTGLELLLVVPVMVANCTHLGPSDFIFRVLAYLALFRHVPAMYLLGRWPSALETLFLPGLVQWAIWSMIFGVIFILKSWFRNRSEHVT
jgi:hypothetical protein